MSQGLVSILNPMSTEAMAVTLGRRAFLREMLMSGLLSLSLPLVSLAGIYVYLHTNGVDLVSLAVGVVTVSALTATPLMFYASLRLNAATLARERAVVCASEQLLHKPFEGPFLVRRSIVAGSIRSRILAGFPACIGFGLEFALMWYVTTGSAFMLLHVPIGMMLAVQMLIAVNLLR